MKGMHNARLALEPVRGGLLGIETMHSGLENETSECKSRGSDKQAIFESIT